MRKTANVDLWPLHTCTHVDKYEHIYSHRNLFVRATYLKEEVDTMCMRWRADGRLGTGPRGPVNVTVVVKPLSNVLPQEKHKILMAAGKGLV